ncbi:PREDICTED: uncharacterized protein LOC104602753 [Nelumbo nucifera]|uniref:UspA domain-containing protein n=2 Tax=Nelumbo nucifera TaxID=4432 RepID=A0A822XF36_NELNU|nr:PREDICTED: uncharacterized protein LOC104602753 [Nelumbo nucifera]DAD20074.1 TPA_asm: hypothetical protein HUJ06_021537 [Nelumbo nucifera]
MERGSRTGKAPTKKVMLVANGSRESADALQWVLSHGLLENDELILLHVEQPSSWKRNALATFRRRPSLPVAATSTSGSAAEGGGDLEFLEEMKSACEAAQPKVRVQVERVEIEGKDKAATILRQSRKLSIDTLVIGQRRSPTFLGCTLGPGGTKAMDIADYLIENSKCTCIGVQKKGQNAGYVLNTKNQKNFWLLA